MNVFTNMTSGTRAALGYITVGALTIVWSGLYFFYLRNHLPEGDNDKPFYWVIGFFLSGLTLFLIGVAVGWIGRSARPADQLHAVINSQDSQGYPTQDVVPVTSSSSVPVASTPVVVQQRPQPAVQPMPTRVPPTVARP